MKITFMLRSLPVAALLLCSVCAHADNRPLTDRHLDSLAAVQKTIFFGSGDEPAPDSVLTFYMKLYQDQFRHFQDPEAPYFMFMSKDSRLAMGMGGTVRMRSYFDLGGAIAQPPFAPALFRRGIQLRTSRRFQRSVAMGTTVRTAREFLFLKIYPSVANKDAGPGVTSTKKFKKTTLL